MQYKTVRRGCAGPLGRCLPTLTRPYPTLSHVFFCHAGRLYRYLKSSTHCVHVPYWLASCFVVLLHCPDGVEYEEGEYDEDEEGGEYDEDEEEEEGEDDYAESFLEPDDAVREVATGGTAWGDAVLKCAQEVLCQPNMQVGVNPLACVLGF